VAKKVVIVGGVALGPKVACRIKRLEATAEVTVIEKGEFISYGGCGIPYYVSGDVPEIEGLLSTSAHVLRDPEFFKNAKGVAFHKKNEALAINRKEKTLLMRSLAENREATIPYDSLVLATGARPFVPPLPGADLPGVTVVATPKHGIEIKKKIAEGRIEKAVVIGGGPIGIEMAEALGDLWGVETTIVEMMDQLLPGPLGADMALPLKNHMEEKGVRVLTSEQVLRIVGDPETGVKSVETNNNSIPCDLVVMSVGVRPNTELAQKAGLTIGATGGIVVDEMMRTSDPNIYAGGDCVQLKHLISGQKIHMPLGSLANRQGRVIGTNVAGGRATFSGTIGSLCVKIFDMSVARAGLTEKHAREIGFDAVSTVVAQADRAHFYPTQEMMCMKLIADRKTRVVLGVEAIGVLGDAVKARVDAVASVLVYKPTLDVISNLEVAYAPPLASAMDIVNNAANALENTIEGRHEPVDALDFIAAFKNENACVLDVRSKVQSTPYMERYGARWMNIPQEELSKRELSFDGAKPLYLVCGSGPRSYEAQLLLRSKGISDTKNIQGGIKMLQLTDPEFTNFDDEV
jgi:NADPH-dependent 2,4-dienoyl-CoA reductase/sulfur reductase-like enzyme/rhodanese-related sulfurtransferase